MCLRWEFELSLYNWNVAFLWTLDSGIYFSFFYVLNDIRIVMIGKGISDLMEISLSVWENRPWENHRAYSIFPIKLALPVFSAENIIIVLFVGILYFFHQQSPLWTPTIQVTTLILVFLLLSCTRTTLQPIHALRFRIFLFQFFRSGIEDRGCWPPPIQCFSYHHLGQLKFTGARAKRLVSSILLPMHVGPMYAPARSRGSQRSISCPTLG